MTPHMRNISLFCLLAVPALGQYVPPGPAVGTAIPAFSAPDQNGVTQSLGSIAGPKGTMLVFFRSADW